MKKLFVFIPAIFLVLVFLNSFVLNESKTGKNANKEAKSITSFTLDDKLFVSTFDKGPGGNVNNKSGFINRVLKSTDGGQTWQDISTGLPQTDQVVNFFAGESDLYLHVKNAMYRSRGELTIPVWEKVNVPDLQIASSWPSTSIAFNHSDVMAFNFDGHIYKKMPAAQTWLPIYANFQRHSLRNVFETSRGTIFLSYDHGLYKSTNDGKNWKQVQKGLVMKVAESGGVLIATGGNGIMRSTDDGEHWKWVISEGGVGIAVDSIKGGFAVISYNTETKSRKVRISLNGGSTWQIIDGGLRPSSLISSIKQMGKYLICGHPDGIFRSSDMGKTWNKVYSNFDEKLFRISVSGSVLYAVEGNPGC